MGVGTCFLFSCLSRKQSRLQASTSVTEARLREPETCPFAAGKKVTATFMAHGSGPWEWRRRPWPWCFLCQRHQILATACLPVSHEVLLSRIQQQKKKKKKGRHHRTSRQPRSLPPAGHAHVRSAKHVPAGRAMPVHCAGPADTTRRQLTGSG